MNQRQFLRECGKSYPEAMAALGYFQQLVRQQCEPVIQKRIKDLGKVIGVSPQDLKTTEYTDPDRPDSTIADQVSLGFVARRSGSLELYFYLYWLREPEEFTAPLGIAIDIWINNRERRKALDTKLEQHSGAPAFKGEPWSYSAVENVLEFWLDIKESDMPRVGDRLDALCGYTIRFLKSIKGVASHFRA